MSKKQKLPVYQNRRATLSPALAQALLELGLEFGLSPHKVDRWRYYYLPLGPRYKRNALLARDLYEEVGKGLEMFKEKGKSFNQDLARHMEETKGVVLSDEEVVILIMDKVTDDLYYVCKYFKSLGLERYDECVEVVIENGVNSPRVDEAVRNNRKLLEKVRKLDPISKENSNIASMLVASRARRKIQVR